MSAKEVSEALGQIDELFVTEALTYTPKQKSLWRPIAAAAACLCLLVGLLSPVMFPQSDPTNGYLEAYFSEGVPLYGPAIIQGADSITIEDVLITMDLADFPAGTTEEEDFLSYRSTATMEFSLHNPSEAPVTINLMLPCGKVSGYSSYRDFTINTSLFNSDLDKYVISVDGNPTSFTARLNGSDIPPLADGQWQNEIFSDDTNVTKLTYQVTELEDSELHYASFVFRRTSLTPYAFFEGYAGKDDSGKLRFFVETGDTIELYFVGDPPENLPQWHFYEDWEMTSLQEGTMELIRTESMTFLEYAKQSWNVACGISASDWACAIAAELLYRNFGSIYGFICTEMIDTRVTTYRWLEYSLTLEPGESVVHSITMPVYPSLLAGGNLCRCDYTLDLLSLRTLNPSKNQKLIVNTPFAMNESNAHFMRIWGAYSLDLANVTGQNVSFSLIVSRELPEAMNGTFRPMYLLLLLGLGFLILLLILWRKKHRASLE